MTTLDWVVSSVCEPRVDGQVTWQASCGVTLVKLLAAQLSSFSVVDVAALARLERIHRLTI